jgi:UDP-N-acetylmuramoyl-L-alanyl-D-glutamate--2,6-diaminopimelate ligase
MDLGRVIEALAPVDVIGGPPKDVLDLAYDARRVTAGALFFCVPGAVADGHDFAPQAVEDGAAALVVERPLRVDAPQIVVERVRDAMPRAAVAFFGDPSSELAVTGITGTNGKTTTAYLLHSILSAAGRRPGLLTNIERRVGGDIEPSELNTPESIDLQRLFRRMVEAGNESCVMEATSHASAMGRLDGTRFAALVFTNLSHEHLDFHGTMEDYFQAKRRLFDGVPAAVNVSDEYGRRLASELGEALTFGLTDDATVGPDALEGVAFKLKGRFNRENALAAIAAARLLGIGEEAIQRGLGAVESVPGRFELVEEGQPFTVVVDYSHKPEALATVLRAARELTDGRVVCVFGCGGDRDRAKRPLMGELAADLADLAIVTSDNPRSEDPDAIIDEVVAGAPEALQVEPDRRAAIKRAVALAAEGDVVVIAGKGHEQGQEIGDRVLPFDDRDVAREALRRLRTAA